MHKKLFTKTCSVMGTSILDICDKQNEPALERETEIYN